MIPREFEKYSMEREIAPDKYKQFQKKYKSSEKHKEVSGKAVETKKSQKELNNCENNLPSVEITVQKLDQPVLEFSSQPKTAQNGVTEIRDKPRKPRFKSQPVHSPSAKFILEVQMKIIVRKKIPSLC